MSSQLAELQHWMRAVVTHPDGVGEGASTDEALAQFETPPEYFEQVVTRSDTLTARQRLEIYQHGYFRRLLDCLESLLPVLRHALGADLFTEFALDFLGRHPSRSHTLAQLDDGFVGHLRATRPDRGAPPAEREDWIDFIIDLATLERRIRVTFDGPGVEGEPLLDAATLETMSDDRLFGSVLEPVPCLSVASFRFPVRDYLLAVRNGDDPELPRQRETHVAFNRRDFRVRLLELERPAVDLLASLAAGVDVSTASARADRSIDAATVRARIVEFADAGLFRTCTRAPRAVRIPRAIREGESHD